jgi:hypothetical protein
VTRAKSNLKAERRYSPPVGRATGLIRDQTVILSGFNSHKGLPVPLRRIKYIDPKTNKRLVFLTNLGPRHRAPALLLDHAHRRTAELVTLLACRISKAPAGRIAY